MKVLSEGINVARKAEGLHLTLLYRCKLKGGRLCFQGVSGWGCWNENWVIRVVRDGRLKLCLEIFFIRVDKCLINRGRYEIDGDGFLGFGRERWG